MMRNLLLSSFFLLLLAGCTLGHYGRLKKSDIPCSPLKPIFGENFNSLLFKTNITVYGRNVSGLLIAKQMKPDDYRIVFTTELGMKLFDFEFIDTAFTLHYCVPQFNRSALLKTIQKDFEILLMNNLKEKKAENLFCVEERKLQVLDIQKVNFEIRNNYYFVERTTQHIVKIEHAQKRIKKIVFLLNNYGDKIPNNIIINHYDIKLKIELNLLKK